MDSEHYSTWAVSSRESWVLSSAYFRFWARRLLSELDSSSAVARICDVGAGDGSLIRTMCELTTIPVDARCIEPAVPPRKDLPHNVAFHRTDALSFFASEAAEFDAIIFKQSLHHIDSRDWSRLFSLAVDRLVPRGSIMVLTMPETIEYPMFAAANRKFEESQLSHQELREALVDSGCEVIPQAIDYRVRMNKADFYEAIRNRFISLSLIHI